MTVKKTSPSIVMAGGGTGGHLFPAVAIAQACKDKWPDATILFVGTDKPFEKEVLTPLGFSHISINIRGLKRQGIQKTLRTLGLIPASVGNAIKILHRQKADVVVCVGGYAAGPVAMAAKILRIPVVLHEQNTLPGLTNRIVAKFASRIYTSFANTKGFTTLKKTKHTGNPIRQDFFTTHSAEKETDVFTVLIMGGSQGAKRINQAVMEMLPLLQNKDRYHFIHQTGVADEAFVRDAYDRVGLSADVRAFFTDIPQQFAKADIVLCRSGATTVAEIAATATPAVFIPLPTAADDHQRLNALALTQANAAMLLLEKDLSGEALRHILENFEENPLELHQMREKTSLFSKKDAAKTIVEDIEVML